MIRKLLTKIIGDQNEKELKKIQPLVEKINQIEEEYQKVLKDEDIPRKTEEFKKRLREGETLEDLLPEAFALVKNTCRRLLGKKWEVRGHEITWDMVPFDVQLKGAVVLHQGKITEMKTGEGKTLVCILPFYLNALTGKSVFLVTVNDYLARRDAEWMGGVYRMLGLTVGVIVPGQSLEEKKAAYSCNIVYGTNNEFGFDYLRDNMAVRLDDVIQKERFYAIVDEVDSILIDEARTPLIISAPAEESTSKYYKYSLLIPQLEENVHYNIDEKLKTATLTEEGVKKMEELLGMENIYTEAGFQEVHHIEQALKAHACYKHDIDYVIKDGEVIIVDEFTGRLMPGRRYSHGLHQALEAKEKVEVKRESKTLATITFQNYFRLFEKLAGMTGTAATEAEEFYKIYGLETLVIPTHKPMIRQDLNDVIYKNQKGKFLAAARKIKELHQKGQPVLVGTISIEKSEMLSKLLTLQGIPHKVLNAKHHEKEAEIIKDAGQKEAVTIATNMAGRGTDIKLDLGVTELDGLFVLGTERHESRRIDNQLRGRSGRQGDPGISQFYVSMEDELMRLFGAERIKNLMEALKVPEDMPIENKIISNAIESAQKKVEGYHFDIRKHLVEYDDVMNKHREIMYARRRKVLESEDIKKEIKDLIFQEAESIVKNHLYLKGEKNWDYQEISETVSAFYRNPKNPLNLGDLQPIDNPEQMTEFLNKYLQQEYEEKEKSLPDLPNGRSGAALLRQIELQVYLRVIDTLWMEHIDQMSYLREAVGLRGYGQRDPLIEYKGEAYEMFTRLNNEIRSNTVSTLFKVQIRTEAAPLMPLPEKPKEIRTNVEEIESVLTGPGQKKAAENPVVIRATGPSAIRTAGGVRGTAGGSGRAAPKVGRNDPCPCGSGRKYKKCCGK